MPARFPLSAKIAVWFVLNLALLAAGGFFLLRSQFGAGFDSILAATSAARVEALAGTAARALREQPQAKWTETLTRLSPDPGVALSVYENDGAWQAGAQFKLPDAVLEKLGRPDQLGRGQHGPPPDAGPPDDGPPGDVPPGAYRPGPPPREDRQPRTNEPSLWPKFLVRTSSPAAYWIGIRAPVTDRQPPPPLTLLIRCGSLGAGGLLLDTRPFILTGCGALLISAVFWLPFVRGVTRSLRRTTDATGQVARGNFSIRLPDNRRDELGELARSVNTMAAQLDTLVGGQRRFLGDVAHELCSPLARMQAALAILEQRAADEKQTRYVIKVRDELDRMSRLVDELLQFSRASAPLTVDLQPVFLALLVAETIAREAAGANVHTDIPDNLSAQAEPKLLSRAVGNLLRNAVRYAAAGDPIRVTAAAQNGHVTLTVSDDGPGVPDESLPRLFDAFYRPDSARTRKAGGTGLGLAIVKTCIESCHGSVTAENRLPPGLALTLTLLPGV